MNNNHTEISESDDDEEEEILRVTSDGQVEMTSAASQNHNITSESPIVPSVLDKSYPNTTASGSASNNSGSNSSSENEHPSADDEGSRDGDQEREKSLSLAASKSLTAEVDCTPRTKKKAEHLRQGIAARRIQRTWKHFYEVIKVIMF